MKFLPLLLSLMKTMLACKSWNTKKKIHAGWIMQSKEVSSSHSNRFVIIFRLEKHFWSHPMLLKNFLLLLFLESFTITTMARIFSIFHMHHKNFNLHNFLLWKLVLFRILLLSSLPHSREL